MGRFLFVMILAIIVYHGYQHYVVGNKKYSMLEDISQKLNLGSNASGSNSLPLSENDKQTARQVESSQGITLFTAEWCGYCAKLKQQLNDSRIPFKEYDVEKNAVGQAFSDLHGYNGVPITVVNGQTVVGYDEGKLPSLFASHGYRVYGF